ncbi:hypothetical protein QQ045_003740 [Rhodiola kirilowii]
MISWSIRGANGRRKQQAIRDLRSKCRMDVLFIQETKMSKYEEKVISALWGNEKSSWGFVEAEGSRGGLLTIWNSNFMKVSCEVKGRGFLLVQGAVEVNHEEVLINLVNVYAPSGEKEKLRLWEELVTLKSEQEGEWVVGGDFNSVLVEEERRGSNFNAKDANIFQEFIQIEQRGLDKGPSDHAAIALVEEDKCWGRKPFRVLDVWLEQPRLKEIVCEAWKAMEESGWKGFTIQRKLARVRRVLSQWNKRSFGDVKVKLTLAKVEWERLSRLQDSCGLSEENVLKKVALQKRIWGDMKEVQNLKMILHSFEGCSGLKINFGKSMCYGICLKDEDTQSFARVLRCPVGSLQMKYLGIMVGANPAKKSTWDPILLRFKKKLASWRCGESSSHQVSAVQFAPFLCVDLQVTHLSRTGNGKNSEAVLVGRL